MVNTIALETLPEWPHPVPAKVLEHPGLIIEHERGLLYWLARHYGLIPQGRHAFLWVTEFPLFQYEEAEGRLYAAHHENLVGAAEMQRGDDR